MPNYEVELHSTFVVVVKDAMNGVDAIRLAEERAAGTVRDWSIELRPLKDEELDTAVSQADAVSQP